MRLVQFDDSGARAKIGAGVEGAFRMRRALAAAVDNVKKDTAEIVPKDIGNLRGSCDVSRGEQGIISWNMPYAAAVYHMPIYVHWTTPGTQCRWVEAAAVAGGFKRWQDVIRTVLDA